MTTNDPYAGNYTLEEARTESVTATAGKIKALVGEISDEFNRGLEQVRRGIAPGYDSSNAMPGALRVTALERIVANLRMSGLTALINGNVASTAHAPSARGPAARRGQQALDSGSTEPSQNEPSPTREHLRTQDDFIAEMLLQLGLTGLSWQTPDERQEILREAAEIFQRSQQRSFPPRGGSRSNQHLGPLDSQDPTTTQLPPAQAYSAPSPADTSSTQSTSVPDGFVSKQVLTEAWQKLDEALTQGPAGTPASWLGVFHPRRRVVDGVAPTVDPDTKQNREGDAKEALDHIRALTDSNAGRHRPARRRR